MSSKLEGLTKVLQILQQSTQACSSLIVPREVNSEENGNMVSKKVRLQVIPGLPAWTENPVPQLVPESAEQLALKRPYSV